MVESGHNKKTIAGKEYWTTGMAAQYLGVSKLTLLNYAKAGKLTHLRLGSTLYYTEKWINEYLEDCKKIGVPNPKGDKKCK